MKNILVFFCLVASFNLNAQTGIGTATPDPSAKLEVASSNKGFLPPRVQLTATNASSPISNPANGLLVFNTVTAGTNPFQVVPGYYYWDGTGQKWVSLSTTVGNVQNQAIYRSTSNTSALNAISTWSSSFNNIASGDLTVSSSTNFALSNGFYKIEWALPYQPTGTYNDMLLQENISGTWSTFRGSDIYARIANGGTGNWGGTTFAADVVDCTSSSRTFRLYNADGSSRTLYAGATFIITKLNPSITTSTTADNLGNHIATKNIELTNNYISNDGGNEGLRIDNDGNVGIGTSTPTSKLNIAGGGVKIASGIGNSSTRPALNTTSIGSYEIRGVGGTTQWDTQDDGFLRLSAGGGSNVITQSSIDISGYSTVADMSNNILMRTGGTERIRINSTGNVGVGTNAPSEKLEVNGNVKANNFIGTASSTSLYLLEANASVTYTLPSAYAYDVCRYSIVNNAVNVPTSWFNTSNYRFTPQKAGYWEIGASYDVYRNGEAALVIQKNGNDVASVGSISSVVQQIRKIIYLNGSTDYITISNLGFNSNARSQNSINAWFQARWVGE